MRGVKAKRIHAMMRGFAGMKWREARKIWNNLLGARGQGEPKFAPEPRKRKQSFKGFRGTGQPYYLDGIRRVWGADIITKKVRSIYGKGRDFKGVGRQPHIPNEAEIKALYAQQQRTLLGRLFGKLTKLIKHKHVKRAPKSYPAGRSAKRQAQRISCTPMSMRAS